MKKLTFSMIALLALAAVAHAGIIQGGFTFDDDGAVTIQKFENRSIQPNDKPDVHLQLDAGFLNMGLYADDGGGCDWYVAQEGAILYSGSGANVGFQSLMNGDGVFVGDEDFYVAAICPPEDGCTDGFFGWMHFNVGEYCEIELVGSAVAFDECGIFVGTIPEPATLGLVAASGFALLFLRRLGA